MSTLAIKDTGYIKTNNFGTPFPDYANANISQKKKGDFKVNLGNEITLNSIELDYNRGANFENNPVPTQNQSTVGKGSSDNPTITLTGVLDRKSSSDMNKLVLLDQLIQSNGYKEIYYNSVTDGWNEITEYLGSTDAQNAVYPHIHIRIKTFNIKHSAKSSILRFTLTCEVTD